MLSFQGGIRVPSYTASKSGIAGLTQAARERVGGQRHQRQRHRAGLFRHQQHRRAAGRREAQRGDPRAHSRRALGRSQDLGGAAVFLASSAANYVQGIILPVDGGWLAR